MPQKVILDTDIGTDVDDCLALTVLLGSPEIDLVGITCVYGDIELRAKMVARLLQLAGREDVPIAIGGADPITQGLPIHWEGHEGEGLIEDGSNLPRPVSDEAADFIVRQVKRQPGKIHLLAIGPLTNIALAIQREPRLFENASGITIMGGSIRTDRRFGLPYAEHNLKSDPEAAAIVINRPAMKQLVPLDVTTRVVIRQDDVDALKATGSPFLAVVADQILRYPRFQELGCTFLHDPLAAALVAEPGLMPLTELHIDIETGGRYSAGATLARSPSETNPANARIALDVDPEPARQELMRRMLAANHDQGTPVASSTA